MRKPDPSFTKDNPTIFGQLRWFVGVSGISYGMLRRGDNRETTWIRDVRDDGFWTIPTFREKPQDQRHGIFGLGLVVTSWAILGKSSIVDHEGSLVQREELL
jgi:hypothetical protein